MKRFTIIAVSFLLIFQYFIFGLSAQNFPPLPNSYVTDLAGILKPNEKAELEQAIAVFYDSTSVQIALVIISSLEGYEANDYAAKLGEKWGVGVKGKNSGVVYLFSMQDREVAIQVGYGLEPVLTDALSRRIIETSIIPSFKQGKYFAGIQNGLVSIMKATQGEFKAPTGKAKQEKNFPWGILPIVVVIFLVVLFARVKSVSKYAQVNHMGFWAAWFLLNAASSRSNGSFGRFHSGSGSFGGFGGGGSSFGGFGGGSFGGGGASGNW